MPPESPYRQTRQRAAVLAVLQRFRDAGVHPTADDVYGEVRRTMPRISLATVYRNLYVLTEQGLIRRVDVACAPVRFDGHPEPHMHIRCLQCSRVDDLDGVHVNAPHPDESRCHGYAVKGLHAEFVGICPACRSRGPAGDAGGG